MRARYSLVTSKLLFLNANTPEIPHIGLYQLKLLEQMRARAPAWSGGGGRMTGQASTGARKETVLRVGVADASPGTGTR